MKRFLLFTILCVSFITLEAQTITWTGAGDGTNWSDSNNWDLLQVPNTSNDVIVPGGSTITINTQAYSRSILVRGASTLTIEESLTFSSPSSFSENTIVNWSSGSLGGEGALTNYGTINIYETISPFNGPGLVGVLNQPSTIKLINEGIINLINGSFQFQFNAVLNNQASGIIDLGEVEFGLIKGITGSGIFNNYGIIRKTQGTGVTENSVEVNNYGVIEAMSGVIKFIANFNNTHDGIIKGTAAIDLSEISSYGNTGTFAPGASSGTLTLIGDFTSALGSNLKIELNGLTQGSEYDLLAIQGDAAFATYVDVTLGFKGEINDEFIIVTTTGTITHCSLTPETTAEFDKKQYHFNVGCRNNNEVVLTITDITLGIDSNELIEKNIILFPNPVSNDFTLRNNSRQNLQSVEILDLNGRVIEEISLGGLEKDKLISMQKYSAGLYLIKINSEDKRLVKKIVKI